jgi:hypothetical protein
MLKLRVPNVSDILLLPTIMANNTDDGNRRIDLDTPYQYQGKTALIIIPETSVTPTDQRGE